MNICLSGGYWFVSIKTNNDFREIFDLKMVGERLWLNSWWFDVLAKTKKQEFEQVVHITWERGSIYFDTVKICLLVSDCKGEPGRAGLAFIPMVEYR